MTWQWHRLGTGNRHDPYALDRWNPQCIVLCQSSYPSNIFKVHAFRNFRFVDTAVTVRQRQQLALATGQAYVFYQFSANVYMGGFARS